MTARPLRRRLGRVAATAACAVALAGCSDDATGGADATAPATAAAPVTALVHFLDDSGRLVAEPRRIPGPLDVRAALTALAEGPRRPGLAPALPSGARLRDARLDGGTATADFSAAWEASYPPGGAAAELAVLAPVVYTATAVPGVRRVRITVEGRVPAPAGSQVDLSQPLTRRDLPVTVVRPR